MVGCWTLSELGQSFGNVAETYHRVRPPYSQTLLDRAQDALELDAGARVLDLADERAALRVRPLLAGRYRLPLRHELARTRLPR